MNEKEEYEQLFMRGTGGRQLDLLLNVEHSVAGEMREVDAHALVDSGCTGSCVDVRFVERYGLETKRYIRPLAVLNADGTHNEAGLIEEYVDVELIIGHHKERIVLAVTSLASSNIFLGYDWLRRHNPEIDWKTGKLEFTRCPNECTIEKGVEEDVEKVRRVVEEMRRVTEVRMDKASWPAYLNDYADVFSEKGFEKLPEHRPWDHVIDLKPDFKPSDCKIYPLTPTEQQSLKDFLDENLKSGRI